MKKLLLITLIILLLSSCGREIKQNVWQGYLSTRVRHFNTIEYDSRVRLSEFEPDDMESIKNLEIKKAEKFIRKLEKLDL